MQFYHSPLVLGGAETATVSYAPDLLLPSMMPSKNGDRRGSGDVRIATCLLIYIAIWLSLASPLTNLCFDSVAWGNLALV